MILSDFIRSHSISLDGSFRDKTNTLSQNSHFIISGNVTLFQ